MYVCTYLSSCSRVGVLSLCVLYSQTLSFLPPTFAARALSPLPSLSHVFISHSFAFSLPSAAADILTRRASWRKRGFWENEAVAPRRRRNGRHYEPAKGYAIPIGSVTATRRREICTSKREIWRGEGEGRLRPFPPSFSLAPPARCKTLGRKPPKPPPISYKK